MVDLKAYIERHDKAKWGFLNSYNQTMEENATEWLEQFTSNGSTLEARLGILHSVFEGNRAIHPNIVRFVIMLAQDKKGSMSAVLARKASAVLFDFLEEDKNGYSVDKGWLLSVKEDYSLLKEIAEFLNNGSTSSGTQLATTRNFVKFCVNYKNDGQPSFSEDLYKAVTEALPSIVGINYWHHHNIHMQSHFDSEDGGDLERAREAAKIQALESHVFWTDNPLTRELARREIMHLPRHRRTPGVAALIVCYAERRAQLFTEIEKLESEIKRLVTGTERNDDEALIHHDKRMALIHELEELPKL